MHAQPVQPAQLHGRPTRRGVRNLRNILKFFLAEKTFWARFANGIPDHAAGRQDAQVAQAVVASDDTQTSIPTAAFGNGLFPMP